ncbi:MAG: MBL fold metallo-hydrolase [Anaerolineales bacterium]
MNQTSNSTMKITFWGVRGSYPLPGATTLRYGGNTPCVEIEAGAHSLILDAGTGIIGLGRSLLKRNRRNLHLLFSHVHHDHTQGLPFFAPAFVPGVKLNLFAPDIFTRDVLQVLAEVMQPPNFPITLRDLKADLTTATLRETDVILLHPNGESSILPALFCPANLPEGTLKIRCLRGYAHPGGIMLYRIEYGDSAVAYATDLEGYVGGDRRLAAFAQNADLLIHDAQYTSEHYWGLLPGMPATQGFGHSTPQMACQVAAAANVGTLALFHYDPNYEDMRLDALQAEGQRGFANTIAPHEGLQISLGAESALSPRVVSAGMPAPLG